MGLQITGKWVGGSIFHFKSTHPRHFSRQVPPGDTFLDEKNHGADTFLDEKNHGADTFLAGKIHGAETFFQLGNFPFPGPVSDKFCIFPYLVLKFIKLNLMNILI